MLQVMPIATSSQQSQGVAVNFILESVVVVLYADRIMDFQQSMPARTRPIA